MGNAADVLVFKLMIDGKEAFATLDLTKGEFVETGAAATAAQEKIQAAYKNLTTEALKYNTVTDSNVKQLTEFIRSQNLSVNIIDNTISALATEAKTLDINSAEWQKKTAAAANLKAAYGQVITQHSELGTAQQKILPGMNSMNMAIGQFGFLLGDADMFLVNVRMGMMSVANNFPMVIQFMQYAKQEAASLNMTMGQAFWQSIKGPGGLVLGANAAMFAMNLLATAFSDTTDKAKDQKDAIDDLKNSYREFSKTTLEAMKAQMDSEIYQLENKGGLGARDKGTAFLQWLLSSDLSSKEKERLQLLYDQRSALMGQVDSLGEIDNLKKRINENEKAYASVSNENVNAQFRYLREFLDAKGLEATADNARKILKEWIDADKKELKSLDKLHDDSAKKLEQFASAKSKSQEEMFKEELLSAAESDLRGKDYMELLEMKEDAENKYRDHLKTFNDVKSQIELDGFNFVRAVMEKEIELIGKNIDEKEQLHDKDWDKLKKKREDDWKFEEEKKKWQSEATYKYENDPFAQRQKELDAEEELTIQRAEMYGASEEQITNIKAYYSIQRKKIEEDEYQHSLDLMAEQIRSVSSSYNEIYGIMADSVRSEIDEWRKKEEEKLDHERKAALNSAQTQEQKARINEDYDKRKENIAKEADKREKERLLVWFEFQKALALAEIGINLAKAISVEWAGKGTLALLTQGFVIAALSAQMVAVANKQFPKGYEEGGRLPAGKMGFFEGYRDEIVAPEEDFMTVAHELVGRSIIEARNYFNAGSGGNDNPGLMNEVKMLREDIRDLASRTLYAIIEDDTVFKIGEKIDYNNRTGR